MCIAENTTKQPYLNANQTPETPNVPDQTCKSSTYYRKSNESRIRCTWTRKNLGHSEDSKKFIGNLNYPDTIMNLQTPFQFMKYFITDKLLERLVHETMLYTFQKNPNQTFVITQTDIFRSTLEFVYLHPLPKMTMYGITGKI